MVEENKVTLTVWKDSGIGWRSKWIRLGTGSSLTHCTLTIGERTLHICYQMAGWFPTKSLFRMYKGVYSHVPENKIYIGSIKDPIYTQQKRGSTWSVIKWKYLGGSRPSCCSVACIDALRINGFECPELIVPEHLLRYFKHDYNRPER